MQFQRIDWAAFCEQVKRAAQGNYPDVLARLGLASEVLEAKNKPCPFCGGVDRFTFTNRFGRGDSYCRHCGHHDGLDLIQWHFQCGYKEAIQHLAKLFYLEPPSFKKTERQTAKKLKETNPLESLWSRAHRITSKDSAYGYLRSRGITLELPDSLRAVDRLRYAQQDDNCQTIWQESFYEGLLAEICDSHGNRINLQSIYLDGDKKASVKIAKKVVGKNLSGGVVRLGKVGPCQRLGLAEGIETALSASQLFGYPVWSALSAFNLKNFLPPKEVCQLTIFADNDKNFVGQKEAFAAAAAFKQKFPSLSVEVKIPQAAGTDWNDVLMQRSVDAQAKMATCFS